MSASQGGPTPDAVDTANSSSHVTWLNKRGSKSFYHGVVADDLRTGAQMLLQVIYPLYLYTRIVPCINHILDSMVWLKTGENLAWFADLHQGSRSFEWKWFKNLFPVGRKRVIL